MIKNSLDDIYKMILIEDSREDGIKELKDFVCSTEIEDLLFDILGICSMCEDMTLREYREIVVKVKQIRERIYGY